ncbi:MAG: SMC family ATPase [Candidatus Atabeyarchaeum deiterrae]
MRLLRIHLHNFKCFKDSELDLRDYESVTVIGPNGAGKSTLVIDALTWAVYGKTSLTDLKGYKQDDLVKIGEKECYVEVEFELSGDIYVVRRMFNLTRRTAFLDVFLNKKRLDLKVNDAEHFLSERIGLDYAGFVNSTIIRQEEMKRLIEEDPSKRKDIFISLFRLGIYEEALQITKDNRTEAEKKLEKIKDSLETKKDFLSQEKNWIDRSQQIGLESRELEKRRLEVENTVHAVEETVSGLERSVNKLVVDETNLKNLRVRIDDTERKLRQNNDVLSESKEKLADYTQKAGIAEKLRRDCETASIMKDEYGRVANQIEMFEQLIKIRLEQVNGEIDNLKREQGTLLNEKKSIEKEIDEASMGVTSPILIKKHAESIDKLQESATNFGRASRDLEAASSGTYQRAKLQDLKKLLDESRKKLSSSKGAVDQTLDKLVTELPKLSVSETRMKDLLKRVEEIDKALSEKQRSLKEEILVVGEIDSKNPMKLMDARKLLGECTSRIERIINSGYNPATFDDLKTKAEEAISAGEELAKIKEKIAGAENVIESLNKERNILMEEYSKLEKDIEKSQMLKEEYQKSKQQLKDGQRKYTDVMKDIEGLKRQREEIETNLKNISSYKATIVGLANSERELEREITDYRKLEPAFHRDGIPSAILRRIIPRVASESSSILAQLSGGRYDAITIEEQEDGKLNIWVKDGDAKYGVHRFSGGEKVRIALAVRLAVSKVLSELPEAGKRLSRMKTLIIDEGDLGSLDGEGVNSTMDIIHELTKLFGLTILISHLDAVKGWAAGNYVIVNRGAHGTGSTIEYS